jgi:glycosyltransferase involved in cell wall biosynthesis
MVVAMPVNMKSVASLLALRRWIQINQPDVINTHSSADSWLVALATQFTKNRPAIVRTRHVSVPVSKSFTSKWLYTQSCDHIVTTGGKLRNTLIEHNGYSAAHITSVRTGIDLSLFKEGDKAGIRQQLGLNPKAVIIGIVATLRSWKGHGYLLEAFAQLSDKKNLTLLIVGDGPQELALKQKAHDLQLEDCILFVGRQNNVQAWMQAMDIFCLPSYANEGVPQSLMQAQACGLPAVTTWVGSINEAVVRDQTALIVSPHDGNALHDALHVLVTDDHKRIVMGHAAAQYAASHFSEKIMLDKMESIFTRLA